MHRRRPGSLAGRRDPSNGVEPLGASRPSLAGPHVTQARRPARRQPALGIPAPPPGACRRRRGPPEPGGSVPAGQPSLCDTNQTRPRRRGDRGWVGAEPGSILRRAGREPGAICAPPPAGLGPVAEPGWVRAGGPGSSGSPVGRRRRAGSTDGYGRHGPPGGRVAGRQAGRAAFCFDGGLRTARGGGAQPGRALGPPPATRAGWSGASFGADLGRAELWGRRRGVSVAPNARRP